MSSDSAGKMSITCRARGTYHAGRLGRCGCTVNPPDDAKWRAGRYAHRQMMNATMLAAGFASRNIRHALDNHQCGHRQDVWNNVGDDSRVDQHVELIVQLTG